MASSLQVLLVLVLTAAGLATAQILSYPRIPVWNSKAAEGLLIGHWTHLAHGVFSGETRLTSLRTVEIRDFHYDGSGPNGWFILQDKSGDIQPLFKPGPWLANAPSIQVIPDETGNCERRPGAYRNQTLTLSLPHGLTWLDVNWIGMYCFSGEQLFGFIRIPDVEGGAFGPELGLSRGACPKPRNSGKYGAPSEAVGRPCDVQADCLFGYSELFCLSELGHSSGCGCFNAPGNPIPEIFIPAIQRCVKPPGSPCDANDGFRCDATCDFATQTCISSSHSLSQRIHLNPITYT